jgi:hypothetical protein
LIGGFGQKKARVFGDDGIRADVLDALLCHVHLQAADGRMGGVELAVQVGQADLVVVDQIQRADPAAGERLHGVAAHAADAEDRHAAAAQFLHGLLPEDQFRPCELIQHVSLQPARRRVLVFQYGFFRRPIVPQMRALVHPELDRQVFCKTAS